MTTDTYYHQEDIPPADADTQVELYEQAREMVDTGMQDGQRLFKSIEVSLHRLFVAAENANDSQAMELINQSYDRVQHMAAIMGQQGSALTGANKAIDALKEQRDGVTQELQDLLKAIDSADIDHPKLIELHETIQEWDMEYSETYAWDLVNEDITERIDSLLRDLMPHGGTHLSTFYIADKMLTALRGLSELDDDQKYFILELAKSFDVPRQGGA
jgi:hypothetical protein